MTLCCSPPVARRRRSMSGRLNASLCGVSLGVSGLLVVATLAACRSDDDVPATYSCPGSAERLSFVDVDRLCRCVDREAVFVEGSSSCEACDSQDAQAQYCSCDGALLNFHGARCEVCPECEMGTYCQGGECVACEPGACGPTCGRCLPGHQCIAGVCTAITRCCRVGSEPLCMDGANYCWGYGAYPPGLDCYCNPISTDGSCYEYFTGRTCEF